MISILKKEPAVIIGQVFAACALTATQVLAQQPVQRVEITGSAIKQIPSETALPITIITAEELIRQGISTVEAAVQTIPASQSLIGVAQGIGDYTGGRSSANLRGLGSGRTLVLLNGRRIANHAYQGLAADLNAIPMAAIERIEVLRDGASSLYGTDAIGGVINFILKTDFQGIEASVFRDLLGKHAGDSSGLSLVAGNGSLQKDGFSVLGIFNYRNQERISALDRDYGKTGIRPDLGFASLSGTPHPANLSQSGSALAVRNPSRVGGGSCPPLAFNNPDPAILNCQYDFSGLIDLLPDQEQTQALFRGAFKLGAHVAAMEYVSANNSVTSRGAPTPVTGLSMPNTSPFYPGNGITPAIGGLDPTRSIGVAWRTVPAGQRTNVAESTADRLTFSLEGVLGGWDYSTGVWSSKSAVSDMFTDGYVNRGAIVAGINAGILNPFGAPTVAGQAALDAAKIKSRIIDAQGVVHGVDVKFSRDIAKLPAGPLAMAIGAEARSEDFEFILTKNPVTGVSFASGATSSGLESTVDAAGKRKMHAVYTEFNVPLVKKMLEALVSLRYDSYQLSGDTTNPKFGLRFQPTETFLLRGSANTGFRAPTLYEIFNPQQTGFTGNTYNDPVLCPGGVPAAGGIAERDCDQQLNTLLGGPVGVGLSPGSLKAETSRTWTIGTVVEPTRNLSVSLDLWDIRVKDTFGQVPEQVIFANPVKYASRFVRCNQVSAANLANPQIAATCFDSGTGLLQPTVLAYLFQPTENLGEIRTQGWDLALKWRLPAGDRGTFDFGLNGTYVSKYDYQRVEGGEFISNAGKYSDAGPIMRWQHLATVNWGYGPWTTTLANRYKSGYLDENNLDRVTDPDKLGHKVRAYSVWDLFVSFKGIKNLTLHAGIKNLSDKAPPPSNQGATFQQGYDPRIADIFGRTYTVRASYKF